MTRCSRRAGCDVVTAVRGCATSAPRGDGRLGVVEPGDASIRSAARSTVVPPAPYYIAISSCRIERGARRIAGLWQSVANGLDVRRPRSSGCARRGQRRSQLEAHGRLAEPRTPHPGAREEGARDDAGIGAFRLPDRLAARVEATPRRSCCFTTRIRRDRVRRADGRWQRRGSLCLDRAEPELAERIVFLADGEETIQAGRSVGRCTAGQDSPRRAAHRSVAGEEPLKCCAHLRGRQAAFDDERRGAPCGVPEKRIGSSSRATSTMRRPMSEVLKIPRCVGCWAALPPEDRRLRTYQPMVIHGIAGKRSRASASRRNPIGENWLVTHDRDGLSRRNRHRLDHPRG